MTLPDRLLVPYGTERPPSQLAEAAAALAALPQWQQAEVGRPGAPIAALALTAAGSLRMSDLRHPFALPPLAQDLNHAASQLDCLHGHLIKLSGLWSKPQVAFIDSYIAAIRAHIVAHTTALTARIEMLDGLVEPEHWAFAAPMPLPRAHLLLSGDPIRVDVLFRDRAGLLAVSLTRGTLRASQRREHAKLEAAGIRVLHLPDAAPVRLDQLGPDFAAFTDGVTLPESPFHGMGLQDPAP